MQDDNDNLCLSRDSNLSNNGSSPYFPYYFHFSSLFSCLMIPLAPFPLAQKTLLEPAKNWPLVAVGRAHQPTSIRVKQPCKRPWLKPAFVGSAPMGLQWASQTSTSHLLPAARDDVQRYVRQSWRISRTIAKGF